MRTCHRSYVNFTALAKFKNGATGYLGTFIATAESWRLHRFGSAMGAGSGLAFLCCLALSWGTEVSSRPAPS
jgi:hypothetical protein